MTTTKKVTIGGNHGTRRVGIGDIVEFKADVEQAGRITAIRRGWNGEIEFDLEALDGNFEGDYIGGSHTTTESASRCW